MATMSSRVYDALRAINVPHEDARAIASQLEDQEAAVTRIEQSVRVLTWMVGTNIVLTLAGLGALGGVYLKLADFALQLGTLAGAVQH